MPSTTDTTSGSSQRHERRTQSPAYNSHPGENATRPLEAPPLVSALPRVDPVCAGLGREQSAAELPPSATTARLHALGIGKETYPPGNRHGSDCALAANTQS